MMSESWYTVADAGQPLTQGDLIRDCPIRGWRDDSVDFDRGLESLDAASEAKLLDVVIMTQACDLAHDKVPNVVLCPHWSLSTYHEAWDAEMRARGENPTAKAWRRHCEDIQEGHVWNLAILNECAEGSIRTEHRIVDFREVYTVPRSFLESFLRQRGRQRLQLLAPYREHLSQAFARFFMRVGLPTPVAAVWQS